MQGAQDGDLLQVGEAAEIEAGAVIAAEEDLVKSSSGEAQGSATMRCTMRSARAVRAVMLPRDTPSL